MYIDSHAHVDAPEFDSDRDAMLARAHEAGVHTIVCVGAGEDLATARRAVALAETQANIWASVGVHPHHAGNLRPEWWPALAELAAHRKVLAIGETGLDYFYDTSSPAEQRQVFGQFLELARAVQLPVICHIRDAHDHARAMLAEHRAGELGCVIHCFTGSPDDAARYVDMGMYISFSGIVTFPGARNQPLRDAVRLVPRDRVLIETDCPYLAPTPMRGKRNEPAFVVHTAQVVAREMGLEPAELGRLAADNTRRLLRIPRAAS